jgi:hypothetical protein
MGKPAKSWRQTLFESLRDRQWHRVGDLFDAVEKDIPVHFAMRRVMRGKPECTELPIIFEARRRAFETTLSSIGVEGETADGRSRGFDWNARIRLAYLSGRSCGGCGGPVIRTGWSSVRSVACPACAAPSPPPTTADGDGFSGAEHEGGDDLAQIILALARKHIDSANQSFQALDPWRTGVLRELGVVYQNTRDSQCVQLAIELALNYPPPAPLPDWCLQILAEDAKTAVTLMRAVIHDKKPREAAKRAYRELPTKMKLWLGPRGQGQHNAFAGFVPLYVGMQAAVDHADADGSKTNLQIVKEYHPEVDSERQAAEYTHVGRKALGMPKPRRKSPLRKPR